MPGEYLDANCVRDDIDAYVLHTLSDASQRTAALQLARALQASMTSLRTGPSGARAAAVAITRAIDCVYKAFPGPPRSAHPARIVAHLEALTTNTASCRKAYRDYNRALDGTTGELPQRSGCE